MITVFQLITFSITCSYGIKNRLLTDLCRFVSCLSVLLSCIGSGKVKSFSGVFELWFPNTGSESKGGILFGSPHQKKLEQIQKKYL